MKTQLTLSAMGIIFQLFLSIQLYAQITPAQTGISGVYEVVLAVNDMDYAKAYWKEYGFRIVDTAVIDADRAFQLYGVQSKLYSYRLQNGDIDSHGLLRLIRWENGLGRGVGYSIPETIGSRMSVMKTQDIVRLFDVYSFLRAQGEQWLPTEPITDDLFGLNDGSRNFLNRPVLVRENAVYGEMINHVFFQRYGYEIPGYGTIHPDTPLKTSEFTHHDFIIKAPSMDVVNYVSEVLGFQAEREAVVSGDWQKGPRRVFMMEPGYTHLYKGFVSPNNICGKLKFFIPLGVKPDRSAHQRMGELGNTMHTLFSADIVKIRNLADQYPGLTASPIHKNEYGEQSFTLKDSVGILWQIIEKKDTLHKPETIVRFEFTNN
ncbi:MAG TPA: hypothetical protein PKC30_17020 [Saprospiraceae bacterium]|nr:hypothetical protein [Saprospiraceae bacterium]